MGRLIDADAAIDALMERFKRVPTNAIIAKTVIENLPPAEPYTIHSDGRLWVTVDDIDKVNAVVVDESKSKFCKQFYMDVQPEQKTGHWILDRSGSYCCSKCMEPCASYAMMKPRDKFCKMCGAKMEGGEQE